MRQSLVISIGCVLCGWAFFGPSVSIAVPVFLKPASRFATGNQARSKLETKTRRVQIQRWFRVQTKDKVYGWVAEDHALTALKLVEEARLNSDVPARSAAELDSFGGQRLLKKSTSVLILEVAGSWSRVQPFPAAENPQAWIPNETLTPVISLTAAQRAFVYQTSSLRLEPENLSRELTRIDEGTYVQVLRIKGNWLEVQSGRYQGYLPRSNAWTAADLGETGIRVALSLTPLRATPLPYGELIRSLSYSSTLTLKSTSVLRWGLATTKEQGEIWWPMSDDSGTQEVASLEKMERTSDIIEKISTAQLFERKIYDLASSSAVPGLKFAAAEGIYRSVDGSRWTKIPIFHNENYPIAVAKTGAIFIGPYVSEDHGETFQQWIRWDSLVSSLSKARGFSAKNLKILEIRPEDPEGRKVTLRLNVGLADPIRVGTVDQGANWHAF